MPGMESRLFSRPLYLQVRDLLAHRIVEGVWKPGASLPNETLLAQELGTSIGTVRKALDIMEDERIITRRQGRGTFVNDFSEQSFDISSFVGRDGKKLTQEKQGVSLATIAANDEEAARLRIKLGEQIIKVERVRLHKGQVFMAETCRLPVRHFKTLPEDMALYRISALAQRNGIIAWHAEEAVSADVASAEDAATLGVSEGAPLLVVDRLLSSDRGDPLEWRVGRCALRGERFVVKY
jgi:GntR family transcriptional regulator